MSRRTALLALSVALVVPLAGTAYAAPGGKAATSVLAASCTVAAGVVTATGLPTDQVVNVMVTDASGTSGWVLGYTPDGSWWVPVATAASPTSYAFVSRTSGRNGSRYTTFASC